MSARAAAKPKTSTAQQLLRKKAAVKKTVKRQAVRAKRIPATGGAAPTRAASRKEKQAPAQIATPAEISHRLHLLLHTIHQIERYEEQLCSMQDAIKRTGKLSTPVLRDLKTLLEEIPSDDYQHDLDAVRSAVLA